MPRIQPLAHENATGPAKDLLDAVKAKLGGTPNLLTTMANAPAVLNSYLQFSGALGDASLSAAVREQVALAIANANACKYCAAAHTVIGKGAGLTGEQTVAAQRGQADDPKTQAIVTFALAVNEKRGWVSDDDFRAATDAGVSEAEILETVAVVVFNMLTNYLNHVIETEIDFPKVELQETAKA
jgi:uncharacterized peroxidase-related enzyme